MEFERMVDYEDIRIDFKNGEGFLKYVDGKIDNHNNYIRELAEGCYNVDFEYKKIDFNTTFVIEAVSIYYDKRHNEDNYMISLEKLGDIFKNHHDLRLTNEITVSKAIGMDYMKQILSEDNEK